jgi:hypothetical protein
MKKKHVVARKLAATYCYKKNKQTMAKPLKVFLKDYGKTTQIISISYSFLINIRSKAPSPPSC